MNKNSKILVVDDEEAILQTLKAVLEKDGYEVVTATDGKLAAEILKAHEFKAVITDINMPGAGGIELLKHIRTTYPNLPTILMTGFANIIEAKMAYDLGAKGFLAKPFQREELLAAVNKASPTVELPSPSDFCKISIDQFISGKTIGFEIFIRLSDTKYIKVAHAGENLDINRIRAFKGKGLDYLHIKKQDFGKYVGINLALANVAKDSGAISHEKKLNLVRHASAVIMENLFVNGMKQESFDQAKEVTETTLSLLTETQGGFELLSALKANGDHVYTHSLGVSLFSAMIAREVGWDFPPTLYKISTAGLFHDIGLKEIDSAILDKSESSRTPDETKQYETHSLRSARLLASIPSISHEVIQAVLQHHESADGLGYPSKLSAKKIVPMAYLIAVADKFCELALSDANSPGLPPQKVIERLVIAMIDEAYAPFLNGLKRTLGGLASMARPNKANLDSA